MTFKVGDYVNYVNPSHQWHKMQFKIDNIVAHFIAGYEISLYHLSYGHRTLIAEEYEIEEISNNFSDFGMFDFDIPPKLPELPQQQKCYHPNKRDAWMLSGEKFLYCPDCKKEVT